MNTFPTLLKREFWEHKGGMLWAPVVVGGLMMFGATVSLLIGLSAKRESFQVNGESIQAGVAAITQETQTKIAEGMAFAMVPSMAPLIAVLALVVLFYALGSLYDDRKDRSVLFWKSMPISDSATVLSKLASMLLIAPVITSVIGAIVGVLVVLLAALSLATFGVNVFPELLSTANFYFAPLAVLSVIPVFALWALPSVAWCMLVSAWAKRAPFLWALGIPVFTGILLSWQEAMFDRNLGAEWFWENVVARLFGSFVPGMWFAFSDGMDDVERFEPIKDGLWQLVGLSYTTLAQPTVWIGLVIGAALLFAAIRLRRYREDAA